MAQFQEPGFIAFDSRGNLLVADTGNNVIRMLSPEGTVSTIAGLAGQPEGHVDGPVSVATFWTPEAVAAGMNGTLYVADHSNEAIRQIAMDDQVGTFFQPLFDAGCFQNCTFEPVDVISDDGGNLYVTDAENNVIYELSPNGQAVQLVGLRDLPPGFVSGDAGVAQLNRPGGLAFDRNGVLYVADSSNNAIRRIRLPQVDVTTFVGRGPDHPGFADGDAGTAELFGPGGLAFDAFGNLFFSDSNSEIRKVTPNGMVTTVAGRPGRDEFSDGDAETARFISPGGLAFDACGNLYVADFCAIRKIMF